MDRKALIQLLRSELVLKQKISKLKKELNQATIKLRTIRREIGGL
jgi:hypothetical protein